jgi:predicted dehydrogenase
MGRNHARVYAELEEAQLAAVADADPETLNHVAWTYGATGYADYHEMLAQEELDLVTIAVPTRLHAQVALDVLDAGVHVLVEKPIAATVAQGEAIISKAEECGCKLTVGHIERFNPAVIELKRRLDDQQLGRIFQIHVRRVGAFPPRIEDVGVVVDLATHDLNIMEYLTDSQIKNIFAQTERRIHARHEDLVSGVMRFENGIIGVLDINWLTPTKIRELTIVGEGGMFLVNYLSQDLYFYENNFASGNWERLVAIGGVREGQMVKYQVRRVEPLKAELQSFVRAVRDDEAPVISGQEGLRALWLAHQVIASGEGNRLVELG